MICPKCLAIEAEGSLKCRTCGAQLHTGVFPRPISAAPEVEARRSPRSTGSLRAKIIAAAAFAAMVLVLVLILSRLEAMIS